MLRWCIILSLLIQPVFLQAGLVPAGTEPYGHGCCADACYCTSHCVGCSLNSEHGCETQTPPLAPAPETTRPADLLQAPTPLPVPLYGTASATQRPNRSNALPPPRQVARRLSLLCTWLT